jgi:hypothetical protein
MRVEIAKRRKCPVVILPGEILFCYFETDLGAVEVVLDVHCHVLSTKANKKEAGCQNNKSVRRMLK